mmetsp:Transcript_32261/g.63919  ORF Transcript_32261/g.63919 Transcript_32261/m.63919 type:complete len:113 (-) Transcript_32261:275-613(-)
MTAKLFIILASVSSFSLSLQLTSVHCIINKHYRSLHSNQTLLLSGSKDAESEKNQVGSSEYYKGFISRSVNEEPKERITGDAILIPTLKFVGGMSLVLILLLFGFLASNGLI